ncbi:hypothetical protein [Brevibacillus gelatini]
MYIRPKQLWWLFPIFLGLFCLGMALGSAGEWSRSAAVVTKQESYPVPRLLEQLTQDEERAFLVYMHDQVLSGRYVHEKFTLDGEIGGHKLAISRNDEQPVSVRIDGQVQDHAALPYALFTPYEHATLLKSVLSSISPEPVADLSGSDWSGYRLAVPPEKVTSLLAMWLGPSFPIADITPELARGISIEYQLWYEPDTGTLRQLELLMQMRTAAGVKQDQLRFRL